MSRLDLMMGVQEVAGGVEVSAAVWLHRVVLEGWMPTAEILVVLDV